MKSHFWAIPEKYEDWIDKPDSIQNVSHLQKNLGLTPLIARVMANRGASYNNEVLPFLKPSLKHIHPPHLLKDMEKAVERIIMGIQRKEAIWIFGDYDVDGLSASALLWYFFQWINHPARVYIPHRLNEGYGMNTSAIGKIAKEGCQLLITVDNGIGSVQEVEYANSLGMTVIVTDHHQAHPPLPHAYAIINPNQAGCNYPFKFLSGVGVAFKLLQGIISQLPIDQESADRFLTDQLDLVTLGTVADIVPLVGENRIFTKFGLHSLATTRKVGLRHLMESAGIDPSTINARSISFAIAPRLNAAGRTHDPKVAFQILTTDDEIKALELAKHLHLYNQGRKKLGDNIFKQALQKMESDGRQNDPVLVLSGNDWSIGVLGLVAGRLAQKFYKPVVLFQDENEQVKGSCRSVPDFDIYQALCVCQEFLEEFGGHHQAAGLSIRVENIPQFRKAINEHFETSLGRKQLYPSLHLDGWISSDEIDFKSVEDLQTLEPFGEGNPPPLFALRNINLATPPRIVGKNNIKLNIKTGRKTLSAIAFSMADEAYEVLNQNRSPIDLAFFPTIDEWNGMRELSLQVKAIRIPQ